VLHRARSTSQRNLDIEGDIRGCFDHISHAWLETHVPIDKGILRQWLKAGYLEEGLFQPTEEGTPQGGIISPVLANLTLDGLEELLQARYGKRPPGGAAFNVHFCRYADDWIITGNSKALLENEVKPWSSSSLKERGLNSTEKTRLTPIDDGFDFLGQNVRKYGGKLLIKR
jgi:RNA-directed DNA polymerase